MWINSYVLRRLAGSIYARDARQSEPTQPADAARECEYSQTRAQILTSDVVHLEPHDQLFSRFTGGAQEEPQTSAEEEAFSDFFEQLCRERDGDECSQVTLRRGSMLPCTSFVCMPSEAFTQPLK